MIITMLRILGLLAGVILYGTITAAGLAEHADAGGYAVQRIEQEDKISVPLDQAEQVWAFLNERYVQDVASLKRLNPLFSSRSAVEGFRDTYFDTPTLRLLASENGVRARQRVNFTDPSDRKNNRTLIQIKISGVGDNALSREEIKFPVNASLSARIPDRNIPMTQLVKASHRQEFSERMVSMGLEPDTLQPILTLNDHRRRIYINLNGKPFISISLDQVTASLLWAKASFVEIEPEINEVAYTEGTAAERAYLEEINGRIIRQIKERFPELKSDLTPKYNKAFGGLQSQIPLLRPLVRINAHHGDVITVMLVALTAACVAAGTIVYRRFKKRIGRPLICGGYQPLAAG